jgi:hypothetical protein
MSKRHVEAVRQFIRAQRELARPSLREALLAVYRGVFTGADDR